MKPAEISNSHRVGLHWHTIGLVVIRIRIL